jgi:RNA polymerase sigma-70 factor (ECF subfamily)
VRAALSTATDQLSDEELVALVSSGDDTAFAALADRHRAWLVRVCAGLLRDRHLAEDVAQETLVKAYRQIDEGNPPDRLRPWLRVVARHACIDERRRHRPEPTASLPEHCTTLNDDAADGLDVPMATAWNQLGARHREVLRRRELQGFSYAEIAAAMGITLGAVETLLFRARAALRREYARAGGSAWPTETLTRSLMFIDGPRLDRAVSLPSILGSPAAHAVAHAAPAIAQTSQHATAGDALRELAAGVAAAVLALGLVASPVERPADAAQVEVPRVEAVAVPDLEGPGADVPQAPEAPEPSDAATLDDGVEHPDTSAPEAPGEPSASDAEEEGGRVRRTVRKTVTGVTETTADVAAVTEEIHSLLPEDRR